jgi:hypothetical protein
MGEAISQRERAVLSREVRGSEELEGIIGHGLRTFIEVGRALLEIHIDASTGRPATGASRPT